MKREVIVLYVLTVFAVITMIGLCGSILWERSLSSAILFPPFFAVNVKLLGGVWCDLLKPGKAEDD